MKEYVSYKTLTTTPPSLLRCAAVVLKRPGRISPLGRQASTIHCTGWKKRRGLVAIYSGPRWVAWGLLDKWWDLQFGWGGSAPLDVIWCNSVKFNLLHNLRWSSAQRLLWFASIWEEGGEPFVAQLRSVPSSSLAFQSPGLLKAFWVHSTLRLTQWRGWCFLLMKDIESDNH